MSALLHLLSPHERDIGFPVKRLLPAGVAQTVGPFIFFDHMGPATFAAGTTQEDVRPHPHIGLSTFTDLFSGALLHRDSLGVTQRIEPGAVNGMTAGRGVVHSPNASPRISALPATSSKGFKCGWRYQRIARRAILDFATTPQQICRWSPHRARGFAS